MFFVNIRTFNSKFSNIRTYMLLKEKKCEFITIETVMLT